LRRHISELSPGREQLMFGIGPRVTPSHSGQPMLQPALNQKHACPFRPESFPAGPRGARALGTGHHGLLGWGRWV
jgi:hypothetical protein